MTYAICITIAFICGYILRALMDRANLPFYRDVHRLISQNPGYLEGIRQGTVHIKYRPGCGPKRLPNPAVSGVDE